MSKENKTYSLIFTSARTSREDGADVIEGKDYVINDISSIKIVFGSILEITLASAHTICLDSIHQELMPDELHILSLDADGYMEIDGLYYADLVIA